MSELCTSHSSLAHDLLASTIPRKFIGNEGHVQKLKNQLGMIYSRIMKARLKDLSRAQRVVAVTLLNEKAHQKVR